MAVRWSRLALRIAWVAIFVVAVALLLYNLHESLIDPALTFGFLPAAGLFHIGLVCSIVGLAKGEGPRSRAWGAFVINALPVMLFWLFVYGLYVAFKNFT